MTMVIPREARKITYSSEIRALKLIAFSEIQRALVIGTVLGDGHLSANWSKTNYRLDVRHSVRQNSYVEWKYNILRPFVLMPIRNYERTKSVWFRTISHSYLSDVYEFFYKDGIKGIQSNISQLLSDPLTIAVWFMDDGNAVIRGNKAVGYHLNTQSFTFEENRILQRFFEEEHSILSTIEKNKGKFRLAIWQKPSREAFVKLVGVHIVPSLKYKLG
jgi:hypothetical protein